jgi:hypothetical protein
VTRPNWEKIRSDLWRRCGGSCEVSGVTLDFDTFDVHHRRNRGMGGTSRADVHDLPNLLACDPVKHNGGPLSVHGRRGWSERRGYLLPKHVEHPGDWPVLIGGRHWVLLGNDGVYHRLPDWPLPPSILE